MKRLIGRQLNQADKRKGQIDAGSTDLFLVPAGRGPAGGLISA
jgi:hypothetical protein